MGWKEDYQADLNEIEDIVYRIVGDGDACNRLATVGGALCIMLRAAHMQCEGLRRQLRQLSDEIEKTKSKEPDNG